MASDEPAALTTTLLGTFGHDTRQVLVPALLYKRVFIGEWYEAVVAHETEPAVRAGLLEISRDTLRETIEVIAAMRQWDAAALPSEAVHEFAALLRRRLVLDLLDLKEGSNEALLLLAMRAPTQALRERLVALADDDRRHADTLRRLIGEATTDARLAAARDKDGAGATIGVRESRAGVATLGASIARDLEDLRERAVQPNRLVVSHVALRHLRDEGRVLGDATAFGLPVDVDFGWDGECYAFVTAERVRLSELLTMQGTAGDAADGLSL